MSTRKASGGERLRFLLFLLDGAADRPCPELGGKTPLEAASKPVIDRLAREGALGLLKTVPDSCPPGSEAANLAIFSYDPRSSNPGRGVLEAASMGIDLRVDEVAFRVNLITIEGDRITDHSSGHITSAESREIIEFLNRELRTRPLFKSIVLYPGVSYRHLLVVRGGSTRVACTPPHDILEKGWSEYLPRAQSPAAEETAALLRELVVASQALLADHPVNSRRREKGFRPAASLWPWAGGRPPSLPSFRERFGLTGAVISAVDLVKGIGRIAGLDVVDVPGATGLPDTNYEGKAEYAVEALRDHDLLYVHVEGPDEAGHAGDPELKTRALEYCDRRLVGHALEKLEERKLLPSTRIAILPDHFTPCATRTHDSTPVPFLIHGPGVESDETTVFSEAEAEKGRFGLLEGTDFMKLFVG